ncbi:MAG TPA: hypothetical protein VK002_14675 [Rubricoccaceae bacterium]|nr:hypothetical protein [Rubricoccaceae bacterium]
MPAPFTDADLARIAAALGVEPVREGGTVRYALVHEPSGRRLAVEVMPEVALPAGVGAEGASTALVSVYGANAFLQLQGVTGVVASEELGEVIFFAREGGRVDGLVVERQAGCSLYANVSEKLLSADFTRLPPEVMMSAVALSMSEPLFE